MVDQPSNAPATSPTPTPTNEAPPSALESILNGAPAPTPTTEPAPPKDGEPPKEPAAAKAGAPEKYSDFTLPEGVVVEEAQLKEVTELFKAHGLDQASAQKLMDVHTKAILAASESGEKLFRDTQELWKDELNSDPIIGPRVRSGEVGASISKMLASLPVEHSTQLREAMNFTGAGNHPAVVRAFFELSKKFAEPSSSPSGNPAGGGKAKPTGAQAMYPDHPTSQR